MGHRGNTHDQFIFVNHCAVAAQGWVPVSCLGPRDMVMDLLPERPAEAQKEKTMDVDHLPELRTFTDFPQRWD